MEVRKKRCPDCENTFALNADNFHRHSGKRDGFREICKSCANERARRYRQEIRDKNAETSTKTCTHCKSLFEINEDNFYRYATSKDGFRNVCKKCFNADVARRKEDGNLANTKVCKCCNKEFHISDFGNASSTADGKRDWCYVCHDKKVKENDARKLAKAKNVRKHKPITLNEGCTVKLLAVRKDHDRMLTGKFVEEYESFLLFHSRTGIKECFRKNDINIDWGVV